MAEITRQVYSVVVVHITTLFSFVGGSLSGKPVPITKNIRQLNKMHHEGWYITVEAGVEFTEAGLLDFLDENGVLFDDVSIKKVLAFYIGPNTLNDDLFDITTFTTAIDAEEGNASLIAQVGNKVVHKYPHTVDVGRWYYAVNDYYKVPHVYLVTGGYMISEFLKRHRPTTIEECREIVETFKNKPAINTHSWREYVNRLGAMINLMRAHPYYEKLQSIKTYLEHSAPPPNTLSHGYMRPENVIVVERKRHVLAKDKEHFYLVNPNNSIYSSYQIDLATIAAYDAMVNGVIGVSVSALDIAEAVMLYYVLPAETYKQENLNALIQCY